MAADSQVHRDAIIARLGTAVADCRLEGVGSVVRIFGEPGIGKSTLVDHMGGEARASGVSVWLGAATELGSSIPFGVFASLRSEEHGRLLARDHLHSDGASRGQAGLQTLPEVERFAVIETIIEAVEAQAQRPTLLVFEDLQWADTATLAALGDLAKIADTHPLLLVVTHRSGFQTHGLDDLINILRVHRPIELGLGPLTENEVSQMLTDLCGGPPGAALCERARGASGNPFLLAELANGLLAEGDLVARGEQIDTDRRDVPRQLLDAIARELRRLDDETSTMVRAAAVGGSPINVIDLAVVLDSSPLKLAEPIEVAIGSGILEERNDGLDFRHDLVREAVYQGMPTAVRAATHRQLAAVLANRSAGAALIGSHLVLADDSGDVGTVEQLRLAAAETSPVAPDSALAFLDRARQLCEEDVETRRVIERARMEALTAAGRMPEAEHTARWLLEVSPPEDRPELRARLAGIATIEGDSGRALDLLDEAARDAADDAERSPIMALAALTCSTTGDYERARQLAADARTLGERSGEPVGQSVGLSIEARLSTFGNELEGGLRLGAAAVAIADRDPTGKSHEYVPCLHYGQTALDADHYDIAAEMVEHGVALATTGRMEWSLPLFGSLAAGSHYRRGELDAARAEAEAAVELAEQTGSKQAIMWSLAILGLVSIELGDPEAAEPWVDAAMTAFYSGQSSIGVSAMVLARTRLSIAQGEDERALSELTMAWDLMEVAGTPICQPEVAFDLGHLAKGAADAELLQRVCAAAASAAAASGVTATDALRQYLVALRDDDGRAARAAVDQLRRTERRLELATWLSRGAELLGDGDPIGPLEAALRLYTDLGATGSVALVADRLSEAGQTPATTTTGGWAELTPTELEIARLLADGLTNAEIAQQRGSSRRTVESHLGRIYTKLAIEGRVKLTVAATEHFRTAPAPT